MSPKTGQEPKEAAADYASASFDSLQNYIKFPIYFSDRLFSCLLSCTPITWPFFIPKSAKRLGSILRSSALLFSLSLIRFLLLSIKSPFPVTKKSG